jgi:hypothetical protein
MAPLTRLHKFGIALLFWAIFCAISPAEAEESWLRFIAKL